VAKVRPFLRSDDQDEEGVEFLPSVLPNSGVIQVARHAGGTSPLVGRVRPQDVPPRTSPGGCRPDATCCRARRRPPAHRGRGVSSGGRSRWCRSWRHRSRRSDRQLRPRRPVEDRIRPRGRPASGRGTTDRRRVDRAEDRPSPPGRRGPTVTACRARTSAVHEGRRDPSTSLRRQWRTSSPHDRRADRRCTAGLATGGRDGFAAPAAHPVCIMSRGPRCRAPGNRIEPAAGSPLRPITV